MDPRFAWPFRAILVCGLPGSGKTTYAHQVAHLLGGVVVTDTLTTFSSGERAASRARRVEAALRVLAEGRLPIIDACGCNPVTRRYWLKRVPGLGAIWMDTPLEVCLVRRGGGRWARIIRDMQNRMVPPSTGEGFVFVKVVRGHE